jgi:short-subunit dehydrogenase
MGLGKVLAMEMADRRVRGAVVARDLAELKSTEVGFHSKGLEVVTIAVDVTDQTAIASAVHSTEEC